jgi:hypothetical protein
VEPPTSATHTPVPRGLVLGDPRDAVDGLTGHRAGKQVSVCGARLADDLEVPPWRAKRAAQ